MSFLISLVAASLCICFSSCGEQEADEVKSPEQLDTEKEAEKLEKRKAKEERRARNELKKQKKEEENMAAARDGMRKVADMVLTQDKPSPNDVRSAFWVYSKFPSEYGDPVRTEEELPMSKLLFLLKIGKKYKKLTSPVNFVHIDDLPWNKKGLRSAEDFIISRLTDKNIDILIEQYRMCDRFPRAILKHDADKFFELLEANIRDTNLNSLAKKGYEDGLLNVQHIGRLLSSEDGSVRQFVFELFGDVEAVPSSLVETLEPMWVAAKEAGGDQSRASEINGLLRKAYLSKYRELADRKDLDAKTKAYYGAMAKTFSTEAGVHQMQGSPLSKFLEGVEEVDSKWSPPLRELDILAEDRYAVWVVSIYPLLCGEEGIKRCAVYALKDGVLHDARGVALFEVFKNDKKEAWNLVLEMDKKKSPPIISERVVAGFKKAWMKDPKAVRKEDVTKLGRAPGNFGYHFKQMLSR